ncbi:MAG: hypothetical protein RMX68_022995 [Aulosira sp. ZfuVER01]|nr:hypothetical protein [Aulosira sp. DedVER01a]MDZ8050987.1 hypothetical protein [Aulosira sp. ZfuCHP01]
MEVSPVEQSVSHTDSLRASMQSGYQIPAPTDEYSLLLYRAPRPFLLLATSSTRNTQINVTLVEC